MPIGELCNKFHLLRPCPLHRLRYLILLMLGAFIAGVRYACAVAGIARDCARPLGCAEGCAKLQRYTDTTDTVCAGSLERRLHLRVLFQQEMTACVALQIGGFFFSPVIDMVVRQKSVVDRESGIEQIDILRLQ